MLQELSFREGEAVELHSFDGEDDYINTGQSVLNDLQAFTVELWVRWDKASLENGRSQGLVGQWGMLQFGV